MRLVLDTSVFIDHLRGRPKAAVELIAGALSRGDELWSSQVVRAELLAGMRSSEAATRDLMRLISWVDVDESATEAAGELGRKYLSAHAGIEVADLILAALTLQLDAELKTMNVKRFPMFENLAPPYAY